MTAASLLFAMYVTFIFWYLHFALYYIHRYFTRFCLQDALSYKIYSHELVLFGKCVRFDHINNFFFNSDGSLVASKELGISVRPPTVCSGSAGTFEAIFKSFQYH